MSATLNVGNGLDGDITISSNFNCSTGISIAGRSYADAVYYAVTSVGSNSVQTSVAPNGLNINDEVLLITAQGTATNYDNVGNYETFIVQNINGSTVTFTAPKTKLYGQNGGDVVGSHKIVLQRVPNYNNLTINGGITYTANAWDGTYGGIIFFRVKNTFLNYGTLTTSTLGFRGGTGRNTGAGYSGESFNGGYNSITTSAANGGGGGGGINKTSPPTTESHGAGSSYGTAGARLGTTPAIGNVYGVNTLTSLFLGSGGAAGGAVISNGATAVNGGKGGGIIYISANIYRNHNIISSSGSAGTVGSWLMYGSGGTGGSVLVDAGTLYFNSSSITAIGANGGGGAGHKGGDGRIAMYYKSLGDSIVNINPSPYTNSSISSPYKIKGLISESAKLYLYRNSDGTYVNMMNVTSGGNYEFIVPSYEQYILIAIPNNDGQLGGFERKILPVVD
jgi:hypothetical protein